MNKRVHIRTDEREDVIQSLELVAKLVPMLEQDDRLWKWVVIGAHSALQGALVCALSGMAGIGAFTKKSQAEWIEWFEDRSASRGPAPEERLADFRELLKRAMKPGLMDHQGGQPLVLAPGATPRLTAAA